MSNVNLIELKKAILDYLTNDENLGEERHHDEIRHSIEDNFPKATIHDMDVVLGELADENKIIASKGDTWFVGLLNL